MYIEFYQMLGNADKKSDFLKVLKMAIKMKYTK